MDTVEVQKIKQQKGDSMFKKLIITGFVAISLIAISQSIESCSSCASKDGSKKSKKSRRNDDYGRYRQNYYFDGNNDYDDDYDDEYDIYEDQDDDITDIAG
jgi:hypothetical protein